MANRSAQAHLNSAQVSEIKRTLHQAWDINPLTYVAEVRRLAVKWGLRTDTIKELGRVGHKERTR